MHIGIVCVIQVRRNLNRTHVRFGIIFILACSKQIQSAVFPPQAAQVGGGICIRLRLVRVIFVFQFDKEVIAAIAVVKDKS